jgi:hypothetical protein
MQRKILRDLNRYFIGFHVRLRANKKNKCRFVVDNGPQSRQILAQQTKKRNGCLFRQAHVNNFVASSLFHDYRAHNLCGLRLR